MLRATRQHDMRDKVVEQREPQRNNSQNLPTHTLKSSNNSQSPVPGYMEFPIKTLGSK